MSKWISVNDCLPDKGIRCLTYSPCLDDTTKYRIIETNNGRFYSDVKFWMYLPSAPSLISESAIKPPTPAVQASAQPVNEADVTRANCSRCIYRPCVSCISKRNYIYG